MIYIIVFLTILVIVCFIRILWYRLEVRHINKQLNFIIKNDTNTIVWTGHVSKEIRTMVENINNIIGKYRKLEIDATNKEKSVKADFTNLSHDIRTPLTAIYGYFQLLCETENVEEKQLYMKIINRRLDSLKSILESIFMYSKLQNDNYEMNLYKLDLNKLITDVTLSFYQDILEKKMEPTISFCDKPVFVYGTEDAFTRIIQNIISNALVHGKSCIELKLEVTESKVHFICTNDINENDSIDIDKIFDRFYKADLNRTQLSSGLGLSIAKMLSTKMGAQIYAEKPSENKFAIHVVIPYKN